MHSLSSGALLALISSVAIGSGTEFLHVLLAEEDNDSCCQIPSILTDHTVFCHGPFPHGSTDCWEHVGARPWQNGSCSDQGFKGRSFKGAANVTGQTDMFKCDFKGWDWSPQLPVELSMAEFLKNDHKMVSAKYRLPDDSDRSHATASLVI